MSSPPESASENAGDKIVKTIENVDRTEEQHSQLKALIQKVTDAVETLKHCKDYNSEESLRAFELLSECSQICALRRRIADHVVKLDVHELFPLAWKQLKETLISIEGDAKDRTLNILLRMKTFYTNLTDVSPRLCQLLGQQGVIMLLFKEFANDFQVADDVMEKDQLAGSLGILHNCIRLWNDNVDLYREVDALQLLTKYVRSNNTLANKTKCLLILAYIVDEEESGNLATKDGIVTYLLDLLKKAVATPEHRGQCEETEFSVAELLDGLNRVAKNDANKVKIVEGGGVTILADILRQDFSLEEHTLSARGLWILAFVVSNREIIKKHRNILQVLGTFRTSSVRALQKAGAGALWEINGGQNFQEESNPVQTASSGSHVMISYQWEDQKKMVYLKEALVKAGYNVWIDIDKTEGNILDSMATGVEMAAVILVAVSQKYRDSLNCRSEASYAYRRQKLIIPLMVQDGYRRPDGWLGILIAMNKYYKCYTETLIDEQLPSLIQALGDKGRL